MGVKNLWRLLLPIGHRISIETLTGRTLAVDASIWLTQFLKANRDPDTGAVRPAAHLIGFVRRICKLLYHGIRPVFVFDGPTPAIKLREVKARRERRERTTLGVSGEDGDDGAVKRMARKLLVSELTKRREIEAAAAAGERGPTEEGVGAAAGADGSKKSSLSSSGAFSAGFNLGEEEAIEEEAIEGEAAGEAAGGTRPIRDESKEEGDGKEDDGAIGIPSADRRREEGAMDPSSEGGGGRDRRGMMRDAQQTPNDWDAAVPTDGGPDDGDGDGDGSSSSIQIPQHSEDIDLDAVAHLPPSDRKDVIEKARKQQRLRSRNEFMPVAADPVAYSQVQLRNFLRTSNLNKKIVQVGVKVAKAGGGEDGGLEGERIASDSTRRFVFTKDGDGRENSTAEEGGDGEEDSGGGSGERTGFSPPTTTAGGAVRTVRGNLDPWNYGDSSPPERRLLHRGLRRKVGAADGARSSRSEEEDSDDDNIVFDDDPNDAGRETIESNSRRRAIYSSSDDESAGGGFFVGGDDPLRDGPSSRAAAAEGERSPDPKRLDYESHVRRDGAKGWTTLDERNVFAADDDGGADEGSSDEEEGGGGFLAAAADASGCAPPSKGGTSIAVAGLKAGGTDGDGRGSQRSAQILEDEMLARAIQETEADEESSHAGDDPTSGDGGFVASSSRSRCGSLPEDGDAVPGKGRSGEPGSSSHERTSDEALAAQLQAEEDGRCFQEGRSSSSSKLLKTVDLTTSDGEGEGRASKLVSGCVARTTKTFVSASPITEAMGQEVTHIDSDESDEIDWEDGNEAAADDDNRAENMAQLDVDHVSEIIDNDDSDEDIDWEGGNDKDASDQVPPDENSRQQIGKEGGETNSCSMPQNDVASDSMVVKDGICPRDDFREDAKSDELRSGTDTKDTRSPQRNSLSATYVESDADDENDFDIPVENRNVKALHQAEATAANLTNWAGRAVRRAIAAHMEETGFRNDGSALDEGFEHDNGGNDDSAIEQVEKSTHARKSGNAGEFGMMASQSNSQPALRQTVDEDTVSANIGTASPTAHPLMDTSLEALRKEDNQMQEELNRQQRDMDTVTDEMTEEIQELLRLFGIPYLEAPAEAEAQCCALEDLNLVDGIVTEDSDAFVFGGKSIFKNIFDNQKYVEVYLARDAERDLGLAKNQMVALAMLLGGDYTDGVKGVGIVNGMEILEAFNFSDDVMTGLDAFRQWLDGFDPSDRVESSMKPAEKEFHRKHRSARTRWVAPNNFPSPVVLNAYQKPVVDRSEARFSWGTPDLENLRTFCFRKMGWDTEELDRVVSPVMKRLESSVRQTRLESYFMSYDDDIRFANVKSKRLKSVLGKIKSGSATKDTPNECEEENGNGEEGKETKRAAAAGALLSEKETGGKTSKRRARSTNKKSKKKRNC